MEFNQEDYLLKKNFANFYGLSNSEREKICQDPSNPMAAREESSLPNQIRKRYPDEEHIGLAIYVPPVPIRGKRRQKASQVNNIINETEELNFQRGSTSKVDRLFAQNMKKFFSNKPEDEKASSPYEAAKEEEDRFSKNMENFFGDAPSPSGLSASPIIERKKNSQEYSSFQDANQEKRKQYRLFNPLTNSLEHRYTAKVDYAKFKRDESTFDKLANDLAIQDELAKFWGVDEEKNQPAYRRYKNPQRAQKNNDGDVENPWVSSKLKLLRC